MITPNRISTIKILIYIIFLGGNMIDALKSYSINFS
jgi:hypothetical protein